MAIKKTMKAMKISPIKKIDTSILTNEIANPYKKILSFFDFMPNPDEVLRDRGETLALYKKMLLDARVYSLLELRKSMALNRSYSVISERSDVVEFIYQCLEGINFWQACKNILSALEFGFSVTEIIWEVKDGKYIPSALKYRDPERFVFDYQGNLYFLQYGEKVLLETEYKFIVHRHGSTESPYGSSVLKQCYWPMMFKQAGWRFWMTAAEKFGVPTVLAIFESEDEEQARKRAIELAQALANIQGDAAVALGNVKDVKTLEVRGSLDNFKTLIEACDNQIAYAITGQSLASAEGQYGTRAQAEVHERMFQSVAKQDAIALANTLTRTLIRWICELNFGPDVSAVFEFDVDEYASWDTIKSAIELGIPISKSTLYREYNIPEPEDPNDAFVSPKVQPQGSTLLFADIDKKKRKFLRIS